MKYIPSLDKNFKPFILELEKYNNEVKNSKNSVSFIICIERNDNYNYIYKYNIFAENKENDEINYLIAERLIKSILWTVGGYKVYISGSKKIADRIKAAYSKGGEREFDANFMSKVYESKFEVIYCSDKNIPVEKKCSLSVGGNLDGCRIGFDAGGSDRKVSAVVDGKVVYSEEVIWFPKTSTDPSYHYNEILTAMKTAATKMPKVDAIGVSSAGIYINNKIMVASLFLKVSKEDFDSKVKNMYIDIAKEFGDVPLEVANDGDVTALAGAIDLNDNNVLGIAMGTSEAAGYINEQGGINGWLSEFAFVPVDLNTNSMVDEWSGDYGCGVKYFSQDSVIKLAEYGGYKFDESLSPAEKLKVIQKLMDKGDPLATEIYDNIGTYLGYSIPLYAMFYDIKHILLLGRVTSGKGGDIVLNKAKKIIKEEFSQYSNLDISMPDETNKRVGQSIAAASLPKIK